MKFCTKCGAQNTDEAQACVQCQSAFSNFNDLYNRKSQVSHKVIINVLGVLNGLASIILGIITFTQSSLPKDILYILEKEASEEVSVSFDVLILPAKVMSFGTGSLLVVFGVALTLCFLNKMISKKQGTNH